MTGPANPRQVAFEYAVLRVVPCVERGEAFNAGVLVYARELDFLGARVQLDPGRLAALDPTADPIAIAGALAAVAALCADGPAEAARRAGPAGAEDRGRRFRRLTAPRSTVVQPGPVHTGLTADPAATLEHLFTTLVLPVRPARPGTAGGVAVWSSTAWLERTTAWLDEQLDASAIERSGPVRQPRIRPWATVLTAPTTAGPVWLKATAPRAAFEVGLYRLLHRIVPDRVLGPLADDPARGWLLLPDAGPTLAAKFGGDELLDALATALPQYARLQRRLAPYAGELLAVGVEDMRPDRLPERFEQALEVAGRYVTERGAEADRDALRRLAGLRPAVARWCARLAAAPGPASLDHNDLHPNNVLLDPAGRLDPARFYDWGDAVLAHPFASLLTGLDSIARFVPGVEEPQLRRLRDAYLAEFADLAEFAELVETAELARRLARIARAIVWDRALRPGGDDTGFEFAESWLRAPLDQLIPLLRALTTWSGVSTHPGRAQRRRLGQQHGSGHRGGQTDPEHGHTSPAGPGRRAARSRPCPGSAPGSPGTPRSPRRCPRGTAR